jgi:hypothetical protein
MFTAFGFTVAYRPEAKSTRNRNRNPKRSLIESMASLPRNKPCVLVNGIIAEVDFDGRELYR